MLVCLNQYLKNNISKIIKDVIKLMKQNNDGVIITFDEKKDHFLSCDQEQMNRVFINIFKNAIESLKEKYEKVGDFSKKIDIEISSINDYINIVIDDNGIGFDKENFNNLSKPYFTTKKKGSGLGLSIVEKILNDHNGSIEFLKKKEGAKIKIILPNYVN